MTKTAPLFVVVLLHRLLALPFKELQFHMNRPPAVFQLLRHQLSNPDFQFAPTGIGLGDPVEFMQELVRLSTEIPLQMYRSATRSSTAWTWSRGFRSAIQSSNATADSNSYQHLSGRRPLALFG